MPIHEESFRIGVGRYLQGAGIVSRLGEEVARFGSSPLIIAGKTAFEIAGERVEQSLRETAEKTRVIIHTGTCNDERATEIAEEAKRDGFDVIIGVGGGVIMDFTKLTAHFAGLPVLLVPTSSATCACYTPLSVRYTPEGNTVGSKHYPNEVNGVLADTEIIATQPVRLLLSGVFDAIAKYVEIRHRFKGDIDAEYPIGLDYAYALAQQTYRFLLEKTSVAIEDMQAGRFTKELENLFFTTIAATGVVSGIARGSNQSALGHKFYETTRYFFPEESKPYLHGEIVGVGLLLQNYYNGEAEENEALLAWMRSFHMPCTVAGVGIDPSDETFERYYEKIRNSSSINKDDAEECARFRTALRYLWDLR